MVSEGTDRKVGRGFPRWHLRGHQDRPGGCITTIDSALGAFEHFDLLQIRIFTVEGSRIGVEDAIEDEGEAVLRVAGSVDTANIDLCIANFGRVNQSDAGSQP